MKDELPICCQNCEELDSDQQDYCAENYFCLKNIWWPYAKQTCKKQKPYNKLIIIEVNR